MSGLQELKELGGYPFVGTSATEAVKIGQQAQANVLDKPTATAKLQELYDREHARNTNNLPEQVKFETAIIALIDYVNQLA